MDDRCCALSHAIRRCKPPSQGDKHVERISRSSSQGGGALQSCLTSPHGSSKTLRSRKSRKSGSSRARCPWTHGTCAASLRRSRKIASAKPWNKIIEDLSRRLNLSSVNRRKGSNWREIFLVRRRSVGQDAFRQSATALAPPLVGAPKVRAVHSGFRRGVLRIAVETGA